jgi:hypothetical protein
MNRLKQIISIQRTYPATLWIGRDPPGNCGQLGPISWTGVEVRHRDLGKLCAILEQKIKRVFPSNEATHAMAEKNTISCFP